MAITLLQCDVGVVFGPVVTVELSAPIPAGCTVLVAFDDTSNAGVPGTVSDSVVGEYEHVYGFLWANGASHRDFFIYRNHPGGTDEVLCEGHGSYAGAVVWCIQSDRPLELFDAGHVEITSTSTATDAIAIDPLTVPRDAVLFGMASCDQGDTTLSPGTGFSATPPAGATGLYIQGQSRAVSAGSYPVTWTTSLAGDHVGAIAIALAELATTVNAATPASTSGPAVSTVALTTTGGFDTVFLGFAQSRAPNIVPTDTFGNTWTPLLDEQTVVLDGITYYCRAWICIAGTGGANHQFTATNAGTGAAFITAHFIEVVGDVVGLDVVGTWDVDTTAPYESAVLSPAAPSALVFAFNQIFATADGASITHGDDGFEDVASAYLNGFVGPVGEIRYQFGSSADTYQTIVTATNPSPRDVGAFLFSLELSAGGEGVELDGAVSSESNVEGGLQLAVGLQGGLTSVSTAQGSLGLAMPLEGAASSVSGLSGSLGVSTALQGTIASTSDLAGDLTVVGDVSLVGTAASVSAVQGQLGLNLLLSSEARSVSETHGSLGLSTPLSGTISSESALSGGLSVAGESALAGAISSVSALRGELNLSIGLAGFSRSESSLSGELSIGGELTLNGTISSVSRLSGVLSTGPYIDLQESITLGAYGSVRIYSNGTRLFTV